MTRHVVAIADLADEEIEEIFRRTERMEKALAAGETLGDAGGRIMATLFYEPSTRTRLSFEAAMWRLGGAVISAPDMKSSSAAKGETLADTMKVVSSYADLLLELHAYLAFSMLGLVALHIGNALHDYMMRAPGEAATRKN